MMTTFKPLGSHCASDLMSTELVMIPAEISLQGAARLLSRAQVSGAPVIDDAGRLVGMLSAIDFIHWAEHGGETSHGCDCGDTAWKPWQMLDHPEHSETRVVDVMTRNPVTAAPKTSIADISRMMLDAHIHRILIVNGGQRPVGIVTSTDILAAVARADAFERAQAEHLAEDHDHDYNADADD